MRDALDAPAFVIRIRPFLRRLVCLLLGHNFDPQQNWPDKESYCVRCRLWR